ncbi:MAG: DUF1080 domain-containing protein [Candidatus Hydrogenedentota bacterium]
MHATHFTIRLLPVLLAALCLGLPGTAAGAQDTDDGWERLFNGEDLSGWEYVNCPPETFTVRDEMIICSGEPISTLRTDRMYENFILELEWRHMEPEGNAGLFIWSNPLPAVGQPFSRAIEVQILDGRNTENYTSHGDVFGIHGATMEPRHPHPNGWMRSLPSERRANSSPEWNHYRVTCDDGAIALEVNGEEVNGATNAHFRKGYICLESEGSETHFRNIRIKELPSTNPSPDEIAPEAEGFRTLYSGLDLRGWTHEAGEDAPWRPNDWRLVNDGDTGGADLWTDEEFEDFVLIADWRLTGEPEPAMRPVIQPDGTIALDEDGDPEEEEVMDAGESGVYLRGERKAEVNIWSRPIGSGEIHGYRADESQPAEIRRAATPAVNADRSPGEWNRFEITMQGDRVTVVLNDEVVIEDAQLPDVPGRGPIGLQDAGAPVEFANIFIKKLKAD